MKYLKKLIRHKKKCKKLRNTEEKLTMSSRRSRSENHSYCGISRRNFMTKLHLLVFLYINRRLKTTVWPVIPAVTACIIDIYN